MSLKILVAPASYKGSIAAHRLATVMAEACRKLCNIYTDCEIVVAPIADGGDDTLTSLHQALAGEMLESAVIGPIGETVQAGYLKLTDTAVVELAWASGIAYLSAETLAPLTAHTYGTGQLIDRAITGGAKKVVVTLGGSASTDGGTGALAALGAKFLDAAGRQVPLGGGFLSDIATVDLADLVSKIAGVEFVVATDVTSPLLGETGAAAVFGPQKGATGADVVLLDTGLAHFAKLLESQLPAVHMKDLALCPGSGAAGGAGFGFASVLGAKIVSGFHYLSELLEIEQKLHWCDIVLVAEGRLDSQSMTGKGVGEIIRSAARLGKTILALPASSLVSAEELSAFVSLENVRQNLQPTDLTPTDLPTPKIFLVPSAGLAAGAEGSEGAENDIATESTVARATTIGLTEILSAYDPSTTIF